MLKQILQLNVLYQLQIIRIARLNNMASSKCFLFLLIEDFSLSFNKPRYKEMFLITILYGWPIIDSN